MDPLFPKNKVKDTGTERAVSLSVGSRGSAGSIETWGKVSGWNYHKAGNGFGKDQVCDPIENSIDYHEIELFQDMVGHILLPQSQSKGIRISSIWVMTQGISATCQWFCRLSSIQRWIWWAIIKASNIGETKG